MNYRNLPARVHQQWTRNFNNARGFALCGIENFEFIVGEPVQVNPHDSPVNIFIIQIEYTAQRNAALKPLWCNDSGVLSLHVRLEWQTI